MQTRIGLERSLGGREKESWFSCCSWVISYLCRKTSAGEEDSTRSISRCISALSDPVRKEACFSVNELYGSRESICMRTR